MFLSDDQHADNDKQSEGEKRAEYGDVLILAAQLLAHKIMAGLMALAFVRDPLFKKLILVGVMLELVVSMLHVVFELSDLLAQRLQLARALVCLILTGNARPIRADKDLQDRPDRSEFKVGVRICKQTVNRACRYVGKLAELCVCISKIFLSFLAPRD